MNCGRSAGGIDAAVSRAARIAVHSTAQRAPREAICRTRLISSELHTLARGRLRFVPVSAPDFSITGGDSSQVQLHRATTPPNSGRPPSGNGMIMDRSRGRTRRDDITSREESHATHGLFRGSVAPGRGGRSGRRTGRTAAAPAADDESDAYRVRVCGRSLVGAPGRRRGDAPDFGSGPRAQSRVFPRRHADRLHGRVRRERGRLRDAGRWRRAAPADLAPGIRQRRRVDARRQEHPVLDRQDRVLALRGVLHGPGRRGRRTEGPAPDGLRGQLLPRRHAPRLHAAAARVPVVEALSRRADGRDLDRHAGHVEGREAAAQQHQRLQPDVDRRQGLLPLGPQWPGHAVLL